MCKRRYNSSMSLGIALCTIFALPVLAFAAGEVPDPTRPAISVPFAADASEDVPAPMVLQSTLVSPLQRTAIIDGRRYRIGERVGDARLTSIEPGVVRLSGPTGSTELRLSYSTSSRPVNY